MSKARFLAILLLLPFTGCLEYLDDTASNTEEYTGYCQEDKIIEYNEYDGCTFELDFKQVVDVVWWFDLPEAESTVEIDIYFIDEDNIDAYREGRGFWSGECEEFVYKEKISREYEHNTTLRASVELLAGEWYFIVDNTDCTGAQPQDDVRTQYYSEMTFDRYKD